MSEKVIEDAVDIGIEAAAEMVSKLPRGEMAWGSKEHGIADVAARAAIEFLRRTGAGE